jgi:hypothetical protein
MSHGDYAFWRTHYKDKTTDLQVLAATDDTVDVITVKTANHAIYIQKIAISVSTFANVTWTLQDDNGTPIIAAFGTVPAAGPSAQGDQGTVIFDYGPKGLKLTTGKNLDFLVSATGAAGQIHIEAYEKLETPMAVGSTN